MQSQVVNPWYQTQQEQQFVNWEQNLTIALPANYPQLRVFIPYTGSS